MSAILFCLNALAPYALVSAECGADYIVLYWYSLLKNFMLISILYTKNTNKDDILFHCS